MRKKSSLVILVVIFVAVSLYFVRHDTNSITLDFSEDQLTVTGPDGFSHTIAYGDIQSLELDTPSDFGTCKEGGTESSVSFGLWEHPQWGSYRRCTTDKAEQVILVRDTDGNPFVFNYRSDADTAIVYDGFADLLHEHGYSVDIAPH